MPYKAFVSLKKETHKVKLVFLRLKSLKKKVLEIINTAKNDNDKTRNSMHQFKIVDNNGNDITSNKQLKIAFKTRPVFLSVHFIQTITTDDKVDHDNDEKKNPEEKFHKIINPLVLLTGSAKYKSLNDLPDVKEDLIMFKNVFKEVYGYEVYCTYDPNKPETESLTLRQLNRFLMKYYINIAEKSYDSLIFVWCGYGNTTSEEKEEGEDILITSDDDKYKSFKKVQELFGHDTNVFLNKPKIYIKNVYRGNEQHQQRKRINQQWYNCGSDTITISSITPGKSIFNSTNPYKGKGSYFTECFCNVISQNIKSSKSLYDNLMLISKSTKQKALNGQIIQLTSTCDRHAFLYINNNYLSSTNAELDKDVSWNKANKKAHEMVNEMINNKQQGIVVVATNIEQLAKSNSNGQLSQKNIPFSMMIDSSQYMKKKLILESYSISSFHSKIITFDNITIDGSVYAVDCIIDGFGNCHITQQLIPTNTSVIRCHFRSHVFTCPWPIDIENLMELGKNTLDISKVNEAIQLFRFVLCVQLQTLHDLHIDVAYSYFQLGKAHEYKGEYDKAIEYYEKDLEISLGEYDKAIEYHETSLKIKLNKFVHDNYEVSVSYNNLGCVYDNKGEYDKAIEYHEKSLKIRLDILGPEHLAVATSYNNLGLAYNSKGEYDKAIEYHEKDLKISLNKLGSDHPDVAISYKNLASAYCGKQEYGKAMELEKSILGNIYFEKGDKVEAKKCYENALSIYIQKLGKNHQKTIKVELRLKNL
ncbi:hypothetical protein RFI_15146 [Reticulomyxa filosa]|uniref:Peptidase C14 caspase domain-containing protein n=1 Tax=Reticulomyxa filosa TaxID=46433 RepID=X6N9S9_RETFI|nr:hypothetical protein RFI_15146 [Reticulomyxa filosa]|eukprot:ETO22057.1 hypothetical protein RFI_15146 [Reticulomyxa filosa]